DSGFVEHRMLRRTDIPAAIAIAPDGAVWFTIEMSDAIGVHRQGRLERVSKQTYNLESLGLDVDAAGNVWFTDGPARAVSRLARIIGDGQMMEFDVPTRGSGLGDVAVDATGAVWFLEQQAGKIGRFADGRFTEFAIPTPSPGLTALAVAPDGAVWVTELRSG